jgi:glutathione peroxidase
MTMYEIPLTTIDGRRVTLERYRGRRMLIVNVASRCGFTPQYKGLEDLYRRHMDDLVVLGFPCNQFGRQEPGSDREIREFCEEYFRVSFPLFTKIEVNGPNTHPLYRLLKSARRGFLGREAVSWNFTKFLVERNGEVARRFGSRVKPEAIERELYG